MKTRVIFKVEDGDPIAVFPQLSGTRDAYTMECYRHLGQHGHGEKGYFTSLKPAKPELYAPLVVELECLGYSLEIRRKVTRIDDKAREEEAKR